MAPSCVVDLSREHLSLPLEASDGSSRFPTPETWQPSVGQLNVPNCRPRSLIARGRQGAMRSGRIQVYHSKATYRDA